DERAVRPRARAGTGSVASAGALLARHLRPELAQAFVARLGCGLVAVAQRLVVDQLDDAAVVQLHHRRPVEAGEPRTGLGEDVGGFAVAQSAPDDPLGLRRPGPG